MTPKLEEVRVRDEKVTEVEEGERDEMWHKLYQLKAVFEPIMPSRDRADGVCPMKRTESCPSGHMLVNCADGSESYFCKQCSIQTFQPNENWLGDKCRLRKVCRKDNMYHIERGSITRDAKCGCMDGYHFPNEDQRACFSNPVCAKGTAPGEYGTCESCLKKGMFSDTSDRAKKCKPLANCAKQGRCTVTASDGTYNNVCGPKVSDLSTCQKIEPSSSSSDITKYAMAAGVAGALLLIVIFIVFIFLRRRKQFRSGRGTNMLTLDEMEELKQKILKESERDPALCKKVLSTASSCVEESIGRQIWPMAQELFRAHPVQGKYEMIVSKYKESQAKYTVTSYLQEWRAWRGDNREGVAEIFTGLKQVNREDITKEICSSLSNDVEIHADSEFHSSSKHSLKDECVFIFFPCCYDKTEKKASPLSPTSANTVVVEADGGDAGTKLLAYPTDNPDDGTDMGGDDVGKIKQPSGILYRSHPSPSAPAIDDVGEAGLTSLDSVKYSRQFSQPVQATS